MKANATVQEICHVLYNRKAQNIIALEVSHMTVIADYMVIASGRNVTQVKALADYVDERMTELGYVPRRQEGQRDGRWVVMDYGDVLVELFNREEREYYNLERLWADGENQIELPFTEWDEQ